MPLAPRGGIDMSPALLPLLLALLTFAPSVWADDLDVDLSKPDVRLNVSFEGQDLLLFGAKDLAGDIIVVVRGPNKDSSVRLKERVAGIWVSTDEVIFADAPSFYALAASRPVKELLPESILLAERIGTDRLGLNAKYISDAVTPDAVSNFTDGLIRNMVRKNLYTGETGTIKLIGKQLFRTDLWFPSNVSVGNYAVDTYMVSKGRIETKKTTHIEVHKVGLEAQIYNFAHEHALIYGLLAVLIAVMAGWSANAVFRKKG